MMSMNDVNVPALKDRATKIITDPKNEWLKIEPEPTTVEQLYKGYIIPLAAIGPIAAFIGGVLIGTPVPFVGLVRVGLITGLVTAVMTFVMVLLGTYLNAFIISKLAPSFDSRSDDRQALKLVAYASTPMWIAAVLQIVPMLGVLAILAGLYCLYVFYLGLPVMMKTPEAKVIPYMAVSAIVIIVVTFVLGMITAMFAGGAMLTGAVLT
jgi:hypothetical protein